MKIQYTKEIKEKKVQRAISLVGKYHNPDTEFTYSFIGGTKVQHNHVLTGLNKIKAVVPGFKFRRVAANGKVRISFNPRIGSWSYVGTDIFKIPKGEPTMNLGWQESSHRVVIHEWCHTLNMSHEHVRGINWDKPKVYSYFSKIGWDKAAVDNNLFFFNEQVHDADEVIDQDSIMFYYFPCELTLDNQNCENNNSKLSARDIEKLNELFPSGIPFKEFEVLDYLKLIFKSKDDLERLLERQIVEIANSIHIDATAKDLKYDTISKIWKKLLDL